MAVEFRCADAGLACRRAVRAADEQELLAKLVEHARDAHGVTLNETLVDYARTQVREVRG